MFRQTTVGPEHHASQFQTELRSVAPTRQNSPAGPGAREPHDAAMAKKPTTIHEYLASVKPVQRKALEKRRRTIHSLVPDAEECISYSMPAFRHEGHVIAGFQATSKGCSYYPFSGTTLSTLASDLTSYSRTKSALHFDPNRPLPVALVRKLVKARIAET
jgi:uncharacterized protein YdhG (YjbR/CyaY superfamily)